MVKKLGVLFCEKYRDVRENRAKKRCVPGRFLDSYHPRAASQLYFKKGKAPELPSGRVLGAWYERTDDRNPQKVTHEMLHRASSRLLFVCTVPRGFANYEFV